MVNWQVTATTIICDATGDEVTIMVYKDGSLKCTGEKAAATGKAHPPCAAADCQHVKSYRDKLMAEESRG